MIRTIQIRDPHIIRRIRRIQKNREQSTMTKTAIQLLIERIHEVEIEEREQPRRLAS